jgi:membrane protein involved in colicin uptake
MDDCTLIQRNKLGATIAKEEWAIKKKAWDEKEAREAAERLVREKEWEAAGREVEERRRNGVVGGYISVGGSPATGGHPVTWKLD